MRDPLAPFFSPPGAPLPGTGRSPRGLFIDRWGTLLELPRSGYCTKFSDVKFTPHSLDALFRAHQAGWKLYLIGNEAAVARGRLSENTWKKLEAELLEHLASYGIPIERSYACLDHPEGKGKHCRDSVFLLPNTGAMYHARQVDSIKLADSWVIGDSTLEIVAGWRAGCRQAAVRTGLALSDAEFHVEPELVSDDLAGALAEVLGAEAPVRH